MDFDLTEPQRKRYDEILSAVQQAFAGSAEETPFRARWQKAAELGLTGLCLPVEHGGGGLGALETALCLEAFGRGCSDTGLVFGVAAHLLACGVAIRDFAAEPARGVLLSRLAAGTAIAANAMTEDDAGSDIGRLGVVARREGSEYILDGEKSFATNGPDADVIVTYATTDPAAGFLGISAFAVPADAPGIELSEPFLKMGLEGCPAGRIRFQECRVPTAYRLGEEGQGSAIFQHSMGWERGCLFGSYLGVMERQLRQCIEHARNRRQFGRSIGGFQAVSHRIVTMRERLEAARLLLYRACWLMDQGREHLAAVSLAKTAVSEAAVANGLDAIRTFGAAGFLTGNGIEQQLRDSIASTIFSGTTDIQRELIAREMRL